MFAPGNAETRLWPRPFTLRNRITRECTRRALCRAIPLILVVISAPLRATVGAPQRARHHNDDSPRRGVGEGVGGGGGGGG